MLKGVIEYFDWCQGGVAATGAAAGAGVAAAGAGVAACCHC